MHSYSTFPDAMQMWIYRGFHPPIAVPCNRRAMATDSNTLRCLIQDLN
uniref:Uncharacterized protein n=1 Tax=Anguilla anguilla TaxID=7936 RepID=A0A0E9T691_ANGAN